MKKLLAMLMTLLMLQAPVMALAEGFNDLDEMIGGADIGTSILVIEDKKSVPSAESRLSHVLSIRELKGFQTGDASTDAAINDLLTALGLAFYQQGEEGGMALQLSGKDVLTLGGAVSGNDIYLNSNLLGGTVVVGAEEIEPLIGKLLDLFVQMEAITAREAEEIKEILAEVFAGMDESLSQATNEMDSLLGQLESMNFANLEKAAAIIQENMAFVEAPALPKMCDAAAGGIELRLNNEEFVEIVIACLDFVADNPILQEVLASNGTYYTEEEIQAMWAFYQNSKVYESEEAFRDRHPTFAGALKEARDSMVGAKVLDGDFVIGLYMNDAGVPVYGMMILPMYDGYETSVLEIVYTRQTVAQGVSHVLRVTVDGESVILDTLVTDKETVSTLFAANGEKSLDIVIPNMDGDKFQATLNVYENGKYVSNPGEKIFTALLEGEWESSNARAYFSGKLTMTNYVNSAYSETMVFTVLADYAMNGEGFSGATDVGFEFEGVGFTIRLASATGEAEASIVSGDAVRPAVMDDAAFQNWFVGVVNNLSVVAATALTALPESVLMLVLSSGMF